MDMGIYFLIYMAAYIFTHLYILYVSKKVISLNVEYIVGGYLNSKLKSIY